MDRRNFLKTTGTFIAGATIARSALANGAAEAQRCFRDGWFCP